MQINRIRLVNFRQHELTELVLGAGLTGIIGPNGAGKTTLLEAIAWAMYGMPAARGSKETIKRRGAPPRSRVEVELDFTLGAHHFRIVRTLTNAELYQDGDAAPVANSLGAVTERVTRLLGMTRDEFFNTYFTGQKELAVMAAMSAPERAQFLSRVLGYERIRTAQDRIKERRSTLRVQLESIQASLPDPARLDAEEAQSRLRLSAACAAEQTAATSLAMADERLAEIRPRWEAMQQLRDRAAAVEGEARVLREREQSAREKLQGLERQAQEAVGAAAELAAMDRKLESLDALRAEHAELDRLAEAARARQAQVTQLDSARHQVVALDERLARLPDPVAADEARRRVNTVRAELTAVTIQANDRRSAWVRDAQDAQTKRQGLLDQYHELREQRQVILKAGREGACPTCTRPLEAEFENVLGMLERQLEAVLQNGKYYGQRVDQLKDEPADLTELDGRQLALARDESAIVTQLARVEAQLQEGARLREERERLVRRIGELESALGSEIAGYDQARHAEVRRSLTELEPLQLHAARLHVVAERADALATEAAALRLRVDEIAARAAELAAEVRTLGFTEAAFVELRRAEQEIEHARREAELAMVRARSESAAAAEAAAAVARRREEWVAREREARRVAADLMLHQELDRALADLRTDLNATLRPDLSELASGFVRDLTNGRYTDLELDEDYVPTLLDDGDPKTVISGGEEDVANLALRLAISQMIAERAGQPLSLLILDEIFGSLDEDRRVAVVDLLRSIADRFPQVVLITHVDTIREGFDRIVRVGLDVGRGVAVVRDEPIGGHDVAA